jgi:hypothetical protein
MDSLISVTIVGSDADGGDVRLSEFVEQLNLIRDALRETGHAIYGRESPEIEFRVVDLRHSSPATVVIKPIAQRGQKAKVIRVCNGLVTNLTTLKAKRKPPAYADLSTLEAYRDIARPLQKHVQRLDISTGKNKVVSIDRSFQQTVEDVIGPDISATGSISGILERVNLHNAQRFDIYPKVGPKRIRCSFGEDLMEDVRRGLKRHITVLGKLRYKTWDKFPYAINAEGIDVHELDEDLPSIYDLQGIAPDATGALSSEEFMRTTREKDW